MKKTEPEEKERTELQEKIHKIEDAYRRLPILKRIGELAYSHGG